MKTLLLIAAISLAGCSAQPVKVDPLDAQLTILEAHAQKVAINRSFCEGSGFEYYQELRHAYSFRCKGGGYFGLPK